MGEAEEEGVLKRGRGQSGGDGAGWEWDEGVLRDVEEWGWGGWGAGVGG